LKLADLVTRRSGLYAENKGAGAGSFAKGIGEGGYYGGNASDDSVNEQMAAVKVSLAGNSGHYHTDTDTTLNDSKYSGGKTGGEASYAFTPTASGEFYFNMKYRPFAVSEAVWNAATNNAPAWIIRNGADDEAQDGNTNFATGNNYHGALRVVQLGNANFLAVPAGSGAYPADAINCSQLVLVDDAAPDTLWDSASTATGESLSLPVNGGSTYHVLLLRGHKNDLSNASEIPVLLESGYIKYKAHSGNNTGIIRMVPVIVDAQLNNGLWPVTKNIGWVKAAGFDVTVYLRSRSAGEDGNSAPHGNALWPLLLAQDRVGSTAWQQFQVAMPAGIDRDSPSYESDSSRTDTYWTYTGDNVSITGMPATLNLPIAASAAVRAYLSPRSGPDVAGEPQQRTVGQATWGNVTYTGFPSLGPDPASLDAARYGKFSHSIQYMPFGLTADSVWKIDGDVYLTYQLYGKGIAHGGLPDGVVASDKLPAGAPAGVPAGLSWKTATCGAETLFLASEAYAQVAEYR
jgi:hypothetical protein